MRSLVGSNPSRGTSCPWHDKVVDNCCSHGGITIVVMGLPGKRVARKTVREFESLCLRPLTFCICGCAETGFQRRLSIGGPSGHAGSNPVTRTNPLTGMLCCGHHEPLEFHKYLGERRPFHSYGLVPKSILRLAFVNLRAFVGATTPTHKGTQESPLCACVTV